MPAAFPALCFVFLLSGVAALIFEALWFRQAGLAFGNGVWASAIVVSSYMAGLALGNGLAARYGHRIRDALSLYAVLEVAIGISGLALVLLLPGMTTLFAAALQPFFDAPSLLQPARFVLAFAVLLVPAVAMGATLPVLVRTFAGDARSFGAVLGWLYGVNTLGAVLGAASSELVWVPRLGIWGTGAAAAGCNLVAAMLALALRGRLPTPIGEAPREAPASRAPGRAGRPTRWLLASFACGGVLLALEVIWFRILNLLLPSYPEVFAWLLAVVLAGIALGGLLAAAWLQRDPEAAASLPAVAWLAGAATLASYAVLPAIARATGAPDWLNRGLVFQLSIPLMLGTSLLSGVLFPLLGQRIRGEIDSSVRAAGLLTLANTAGAALGPLVAGFVLLPRLGMEQSLFALAGVHGIVGLLCVEPRRPAAIPRSALSAAALAVFAVALGLFPMGLMDRFYREVILGRLPREETLLELREGPLQTTAYTRADYLGEPEYYRLMTDSYSMSGSMLSGRRYMSLFTYIPLSLHPGARDALLISFGVGTTARSLTDTEELSRIDVVDISRDVLEMSRLRFSPDESPLSDPRVRVHVEDGRYYLATTSHRYDLITAEPPPPEVAGVVNLYTREYFELLRERLAEGGLVSYWLPIVSYDREEARSTVEGFCRAFPDCSLWHGSAYNWILVGSRNAVPVDEAAVRRQWRSERVRSELELIGIERAEQLAALYIADGPELAAWTRGALPLEDNWPGRAPRPEGVRRTMADFGELMRLPGTRRRFQESPFLRRVWPDSFRRASLPYFEWAEIANAQLYAFATTQSMARIHSVLTGSDLVTLPLWMLGTDQLRLRIARSLQQRSADRDEIHYQLGLGALAAREYARAADHLGAVRGERPNRSAFRIYALCMAGRVEQARHEARRFAGEGPPGFWAFLRREFGIVRGA